MKQLVILAGLLFLSGLLGTASYAVRELIAAFGFFSVGFAALILITIPCFLAAMSLTEAPFGSEYERRYGIERGAIGWLSSLTD